MTDLLMIVGLGYSGRAVARAAREAGFSVRATSRTQDAAPMPGVEPIPFAAIASRLQDVTHLLVTAPPGEAGDPLLAAAAATVRDAPLLRWTGYLSTTGVYGDRGGAWVDEATPPAPGQPRSHRRLAAEQAWRAAAGGALDLIRLAGIYGPGRSAFDELRRGTARRIVLPGHEFGRIHRDDIAGGVLAAMRCPPTGTRVLNFSDDLPAPSEAVIAEAAALLGLPVPHAIPFAAAAPDMSDMALSFWRENRRVASAATQAALGRRWTYPTYREGLRAILAEERAEHLL